MSDTNEKIFEGVVTQRDYERLQLYPQLLGCLRHFVQNSPKPTPGTFEAEMYAQAEDALRKAKDINKGT